MKISQVPVPEGPGMYQFRQLTEYLPKACLYEGPWLAGGTVRRMFLQEQINSADLDYFFQDHSSWSNACREIERVADAKLCTPQANTYRVPVGDGSQIVQMINKTYPKSLIQMFKTFDFSVCQFATDGETIAFPRGVDEALRAKRLDPAVDGKLAKEGMYGRLQKYIGYGFVPSTGLVSAVLSKFKHAGFVALREYCKSETYSDKKPGEEHELGPGWIKLNPKEKVNV